MSLVTKKWVEENLLCSNSTKLAAKKLTEKWFVEHNFSSELDFLKTIDPSISLAAKTILGTAKPCKQCGMNKVVLPRIYCSIECSSKSEERHNKQLETFRNRTKEQQHKINEKRKTTNLQKYGVENVLSNKEIKEKTKQTNLQRYGVENPAQSGEIRAKMKATTLVNYGVEYASQSSLIQDKIKATNLARYGVERPLQSDIVKEKVKQTNLEKYGVEWPMSLKETHEKSRATLLEKYSFEFCMQVPEIRKKAEETLLNRYGYRHTMLVPSIKEKARHTNLKNYGVNWTLQASEIKDKIKRTNLERYGVENPLRSESIKLKIIDTNLERYGVKYTFQSPEIREKSKATNILRYGFEYPSKSTEVKNKIRQTNLERYGANYPNQTHYSEELKEAILDNLKDVTGFHDPIFESVKSDSTVRLLLHRYRPDLAPTSKISAQHQDLLNLLDNMEIEYIVNDRVQISPKELDVFIPSLNVALEVNGTYWHSTLVVDKDYHTVKSTLCEEKGIRLIHLHEHLWEKDKENLKNMLSGLVDYSEDELTLPRDLGLKSILESKGYKRTFVSDPEVIFEEDEMVVYDSGYEIYTKEN